MNLLIIGGAGHVGTILRPALEAHHTCRYYDRNPIPEVGERSIVADVNDDEAIKRALPGTDAIVYLAMGTTGDNRSVGDISLAFDVNVRGAYRFMAHALAAGVRRIVYASSLSVYSGLQRHAPVDESRPADEWQPYGLSKRLGEVLCQAAVQRYPDATAVALRLMLPRNEQQWAELQQHPLDKSRRSFPTGPNDMRRLFLAAIAYDAPGAHIIQASGDVHDECYPNTRAAELLGWRPRGE